MGDLRRYRSVVMDSARWQGFEFRDGDIVISTPPKCGTTWMQRLCSLLVFGSAELDQPLTRISPWLDMQLAPCDEVFELLDGQQHRRFIKSHTPFDGLPYDGRVTYICVGRDPRDVAVSSANHMANLDIDRFLKVRQAAVGLDDLPELGHGKPPADAPAEAAPPDPLREWIESDGDGPMTLGATVNHLRTFWDRREDPAVVLFHYADLLADLPGELGRLASALGIELSAEKADELAAAASFEAMRQRPDDVAPNTSEGIWHSNAAFFRCGTSGQWQDVFDEASLRRYDERIAELAPPDLAAWMHHGSLTVPPAAPA
jgi:hypothetical protein